MIPGYSTKGLGDTRTFKKYPGKYFPVNAKLVKDPPQWELLLKREDETGQFVSVNERSPISVEIERSKNPVIEVDGVKAIASRHATLAALRAVGAVCNKDRPLQVFGKFNDEQDVLIEITDRINFPIKFDLYLLPPGGDIQERLDKKYLWGTLPSKRQFKVHNRPNLVIWSKSHTQHMNAYGRKIVGGIYFANLVVNGEVEHLLQDGLEDHLIQLLTLLPEDLLTESDMQELAEGIQKTREVYADWSPQMGPRNSSVEGKEIFRFRKVL